MMTSARSAGPSRSPWLLMFSTVIDRRIVLEVDWRSGDHDRRWQEAAFRANLNDCRARCRRIGHASKSFVNRPGRWDARPLFGRPRRLLPLRAPQADRARREAEQLRRRCPDCRRLQTRAEFPIPVRCAPHGPYLTSVWYPGAPGAIVGST